MLEVKREILDDGTKVQTTINKGCVYRTVEHELPNGKSWKAEYAPNGKLLSEIYYTKSGAISKEIWYWWETGNRQKVVTSKGTIYYNLHGREIPEVIYVMLIDKLSGTPPVNKYAKFPAIMSEGKGLDMEKVGLYQ